MADIGLVSVDTLAIVEDIAPVDTAAADIALEGTAAPADIEEAGIAPVGTAVLVGSAEAGSADIDSAQRFGRRHNLRLRGSPPWCRPKYVFAC